MIISTKRCAGCLEAATCAHTGARWLCRQCWTALIDVPWPVKDAA